MNEHYELERTCFLLRSTNFNVVVATEQEQDKLCRALDSAEQSLAARWNILSAFSELEKIIFIIGSKPHPQNRWFLAVRQRIYEHFGHRQRCVSCGEVQP
jgi:uncharacterized protein with PIN domain